MTELAALRFNVPRARLPAPLPPGNRMGPLAFGVTAPPLIWNGTAMIDCVPAVFERAPAREKRLVESPEIVLSSWSLNAPELKMAEPVVSDKGDVLLTVAPELTLNPAVV